MAVLDGQVAIMTGGGTGIGRSAALMLAAALGAAWVPVHRVTRIDPQQALRYE